MHSKGIILRAITLRYARSTHEAVNEQEHRCHPLSWRWRCLASVQPARAVSEFTREASASMDIGACSLSHQLQCGSLVTTTLGSPLDSILSSLAGY